LQLRFGRWPQEQHNVCQKRFGISPTILLFEREERVSKKQKQNTVTLSARISRNREKCSLSADIRRGTVTTFMPDLSLNLLERSASREGMQVKGE
jgi:hypothetical protein